MSAKKKAKVKVSKPKVDAAEIQKAFDKNRKENAARDVSTPVLDTVLLDSLLAATGEKAQGRDENLKDFCYRLFVKMAEVPDDQFKALPKAARDWYDTNSDRYNAEKFDELEFLPGMHGFKAEAAAAEEAEQAAAAQEPTNEGQENTEETDVTKKAKGKNKGMKAGAAPKAPKVAKEKVVGAKAPRKGSATQVIIDAVVRKPDITFEAICEKLGKKPTPGMFDYLVFNVARKTLLAVEAFRK